MKILKTLEKMVLVNGQGLGGTTTLCTANALHLNQTLQGLGINLEQEFAELLAEIPISTDHRKLWSPLTNHLFDICAEMGLAPELTPKMIDFKSCAGCGRCVLGCPQGAKWDSRTFLRESIEKGACLITGCKVEKLVIENNRVESIQTRERGRNKSYHADLVILAAGGLATPVILENSGIECQNQLFVDPVLCVAVPWKNAWQNKQIPMPFIVLRERYIISPYFDYLSFFFNKKWKMPAQNIVSLMIKLADSNIGTSDSSGVNKKLTNQDKNSLKEGVEICTDILRRLGANQEELFLGTVNAGHPGGTLPLTKSEATTFHNDRLPKNLYIADATLLPQSLGKPPILTIMAMAKRISKLCIGELSN
jgi:ferredoxin